MYPVYLPGSTLGFSFQGQVSKYTQDAAAKRFRAEHKRDKMSQSDTSQTEVNRDSKSGSFLGWFIGLVVLVRNIFALPWLL